MSFHSMHFLERAIPLNTGGQFCLKMKMTKYEALYPGMFDLFIHAIEINFSGQI